MKVSVLMTTYNHEDFIADAMEGVLMQRVDFSIELIVGEDCSTDKTRAIVLHYREKHPNIVKPFLQAENKGDLGASMFREMLRNAKGEYIAICEGDDYWTDPHKLQKQVDYLDNHPDFTICSHNVYRKYEDQSKPMVEWPGSELKEIITLEDMLGGGYTVPTCSLVFRNKVFGELPDWFFQVAAAHTALQILCASKGKMRYLREVMGVYRIHPGGICSGIKPGTQTDITRYELGVVKQEILNRHFEYRYDRLIRKHLMSYYYPHLVRAYVQNWRRNINSANEYARRIVKEDPGVYRISMRQRTKLTVLIIISYILGLLGKAIDRLLI